MLTPLSNYEEYRNHRNNGGARAEIARPPKVYSDAMKESRGKKFFSASILRFIRQTEEKIPGIPGY